MQNPRTYGDPPFNTVVVHGGPGAGGEMAPVARELAAGWGVLEPIQTATSLQGQLEELHTVLTHGGDSPVTLIGHSWGAWLSFLFAATYPTRVDKLILVSAGPFEQTYVDSMRETRFGRLSASAKSEFDAIMGVLNQPEISGKDAAFTRLAKFFTVLDAYDPIDDASDIYGAIPCRYDIYQGVWPEAAELRRSGTLARLGFDIQCPVVAMHGSHDPHPAEGVRSPLRAVLKQFEFILLPHCGHTPWIERQAQDAFYLTLKQALSA